MARRQKALQKLKIIFDKWYKLGFVQFFTSGSKGSALQMFHFSAKFIAEGAIYERKNETFASDSLGNAVTKLYKVEISR